MIKTRPNPSLVQIEQPWFVLNAKSGLSLYCSSNPSIANLYSFEVNSEHHRTFAVPDGCVDIIFDLDPVNPHATICGSTSKAQDTDFSDSHHYLGIRFFPGALPVKLNTTPGELFDNRLALKEVLCDVDSLVEQLILLPGRPSQMGFLEQYFAHNDNIAPSAMTRLTLEQIVQSNGNMQINDLTRVTGRSVRTLQRQFVQDLGISPKLFSRIVRCQRAIQGIHISQKVNFSDLALDLGFSDHPHFIREFKKFVSATPQEFMKLSAQKSYINQILYLDKE